MSRNIRKMTRGLLTGICLMTMLGCTIRERKSANVLTEADIRSSWTQLTFQEGKWIIFEPCEADNFNIQWKADTLVIDWGQEATQDKITLIASENDNFLLEGVDSFSDPPHHTFRVEPVDSVPGLAHWFVMNENEPRVLILDSFKSKYTVVKESCEEFFEETEKK